MTATAQLTGIGVCPGVAVGPLVRMPDPVPEPSAGPSPDDRDSEAARIQPAMETVAAELRARATIAAEASRAVLEATALIAVDPALSSMAVGLVRDEGLSAARAMYQAANQFRDMLAGLGGYLGERAADVQDVRDRVVASLLGVPMPGVPDPGYPFVLAARDLAPADTATIKPESVLAFVTEEGGPTSHTAIIAKALGVPAVVACAGVLDVENDVTVILDGGSGTVVVRPDEAATAEAEQRMAARAARRGAWTGEGRTADGHRVQLLANVGDPASAQKAAAAGAEGVGLFRTEFLFLDAAHEPTVEEQEAAYAAVFAAFPGKKVVLRTLDAGADKPLSFLTPADEPNPALGVRGLRIAFDRPEVLDRQLEAVAQAAKRTEAEVWVMAPMVALPSEAVFFADKVRAAGLPTAGVMVEVPAAALRSKDVLADVDFASIGTNDLAQYTLAADRQAGALAHLNDPWQPALLALVEATAQGGAATNHPVGVCGEAASDPGLAAVLVGLGVSSLSMSASALHDVAAVLERVTLDECKQLARLALDAHDAAEARRAVRAALPVLDELGL